MKPFIRRCLDNARRDLCRFVVAAGRTRGAERAKYLQGADNLRRYIAVLKREESK